MKSVKNWLQNLWNDESGQGTAEYVLLLVILVGVIFLFKDRIKGWMDNAMNKIGGQMDGISQ